MQCVANGALQPAAIHPVISSFRWPIAGAAVGLADQSSEVVVGKAPGFVLGIDHAEAVAGEVVGGLGDAVQGVLDQDGAVEFVVLGGEGATVRVLRLIALLGVGVDQADAVAVGVVLVFRAVVQRVGDAGGFAEQVVVEGVGFHLFDGLSLVFHNNRHVKTLKNQSSLTPLIRGGLSAAMLCYTNLGTPYILAFH